MTKAGLVWSNLRRRPTRTFLTVVSVLVAFLLFTMLRAVAVAFEGGGFGEAGASRLVVAPKFSIIDPLLLSQMREIEGVEGVDAVTHADWFGGIYQDRRNFFPKFPVRPRGYFALYPEFEIDAAQLETFENTRTGAVAPAGMARRFGWQVGDKIPIEGDIYPLRDGSRLWEFDLVGTYTTGNARRDETGGGVFLFNFDYFDEARQFGEGTVGWFIVRVANPDQAPEVASRIDALFENSLNPSRTSTEDEYNRQFAKQQGDIGLMTTGILGAVFFTILLLTGNTMAQALRERIPELAVLKTFGFTDGAVALLVLAEAVALCVLGGLVGVALGYAAMTALQPLLQDFFGLIEVTWPTLATAVGVAVALGLVVGAAPAWTARRLTIVDALRER